MWPQGPRHTKCDASRRHRTLNLLLLLSVIWLAYDHWPARMVNTENSSRCCAFK